MILAVNRADLAEMSFYAVLRSVRVHPSSIESSRAHNSYSEGAAYLWNCSTDLPENQFCATQCRTLYRAVLQTDAGRKIKFPKLPCSRSGLARALDPRLVPSTDRTQDRTGRGRHTGSDRSWGKSRVWIARLFPKLPHLALLCVRT